MMTIFSSILYEDFYAMQRALFSAITNSVHSFMNFPQYFLKVILNE